MITKTNRLTFFFLMTILITSSLTGCASNGANQGAENHAYQLADLTSLPAEVQNAPEQVRLAYQFAVANPETLTHIPCYCGCGGMGHTSNYSCYVYDQEETTGLIIFDAHALGCSICVDITIDTMRMIDQGKTTEEIFAIIDATYSPFGPSNLP